MYCAVIDGKKLWLPQTIIEEKFTGLYDPERHVSPQTLQM
jgi:hypothetical protein